METVRIYPLNNISRSLFARLRDAQKEAARVWNFCCQLHLEARQNNTKWPGRKELQAATKGGQYALHSQSVQMITHAFLANVDTAQQNKKTDPKARYPYKDKHFYPVYWPAQAVSNERGRVVLPMRRGERSIVLKVDLPDNAGACKIVWNSGFELHVMIPAIEAIPKSVGARAAIDLGEIHQAAVVTNTGAALVVSGRGIRAVKRYRAKELGNLARLQSRCKKGSKRWRRLQRAKNKLKTKTERQVRDLRHKGTHKAIEFCKEQGVSSLYIGNPDGVRNKPAGRKHNQRMALWEYGRDIDYLTHKSKLAGIMSFTGTERGTSSQCPVCGHRQKPRGRNWTCKACGFTGHRDLVGAANMHPIAYGDKIEFPITITYLRPGPIRAARRSKQPPARDVVVAPTRAYASA